MSQRIVFLDIDGPIIPFSMFLLDRNCSFERNLAPICVAVAQAVCERSGAKVVFNTTHNTPFPGVPDIENAMIAAGFPSKLIHSDMKTKYPQIERGDAVIEWLHRHPEIDDWIAFDDARFTAKDNLIWIDPDAGLHLGHLNTALKRWGLTQFLVL